MFIPIYKSEYLLEVDFWLDSRIEFLEKYTVSYEYAEAISYAVEHNELFMSYLTSDGHIEASFKIKGPKG